MKKKKQVTRFIKAPKDRKLWQLYRQIANMAEELNNLPDAVDIRNQRRRSAPSTLLDMVF